MAKSSLKLKTKKNKKKQNKKQEPDSAIVASSQAVVRSFDASQRWEAGRAPTTGSPRYCSRDLYPVGWEARSPRPPVCLGLIPNASPDSSLPVSPNPMSSFSVHCLWFLKAPVVLFGVRGGGRQGHAQGGQLSGCRGVPARPASPPTPTPSRTTYRPVHCRLRS